MLHFGDFPRGQQEETVIAQARAWHDLHQAPLTARDRHRLATVQAITHGRPFTIIGFDDPYRLDNSFELCAPINFYAHAGPTEMTAIQRAVGGRL